MTVTGLRAVSGSLAPAAAFLETSTPLTRVEERMAELAGDRARCLGAQMLQAHLGAGGKRLRARLALASTEALDGRADAALDWAVAVELLHNASLVHDDIQDQDRTRRGQPALWTRYGAAQAINAGDLLLMLPFRALGGYAPRLQAALVQILAEFAERTVRGQIEELGLGRDPERGWTEYFAAVSGKTGTLFALPVRGAAAIAEVHPTHADALASAFGSIGTLYQLQDDLLDVFPFEGRRAPGSDLREGRVSALVLCHEDLHPDGAASLRAFVGQPSDTKSEAEVAQLRERLVSGGAARRLISAIDSLAAELLAVDVFCEFPRIREVAGTLVRRILSPVYAVRPEAERVSQSQE